MADLKYPTVAKVPLQRLAATLNFTIGRGVGAHEVGNTGAMMAAIADAYSNDPDGVQSLVKQILDLRQCSQEVDEMIKRDSAIII
jgi:hypothetical protein